MQSAVLFIIRGGLSLSGATQVHPVRGLLMSDQPDFAKLIAAIASHRDRDAFAAVFEFYAPRIKSMLMRAGMPSDLAEEIAQEAMLSVWRKASSYDASRAGVSTWIFTIARNLRIDRFRREKSPDADALYDALAGDPPEQPDEMLEAFEREGEVRRALQSLSEDQRTVMQLSLFGEKSHSEIANQLGLPLGTVKSRIRLAMMRLREKLEDGS